MTERLFEPSNSDEGLGFEERWCNICERDRVWREGGWERGEGGCVHLANAYAECNEEWRYDKHERPYCRRWIAEGQPLPLEPGDGQLSIPTDPEADHD